MNTRIRFTHTRMYSHSIHI